MTRRVKGRHFDVLYLNVAEDFARMEGIQNGVWCVECDCPSDEVEHGTPPLYSAHTYVTCQEVPS